MNDLASIIRDHLKCLNLSKIALVYEELAHKAGEGKLSYEEYLLLLLDEEVKRKNEASVAAKLKKARFPFQKTLEQFDFSFQGSVNEKELIQCGNCSFIEARENIIFLGPPGVGKSHLAVALGIKACFAKYRVLFMTLGKLLEELLMAERTGNLLPKLLDYSRLHLLIIDEVGYMPISREQANLLFQLISIRYEKGSIILTSNYPFDEWGKIFEDQVVATAIIDRLVHHAHLFYINGTSYRLKGKLKKGGNQ
jgi:DNA replication protein DnaC